MASLLAELKSFRKEHTDASNDTKATLVRVENTLKEVVERTAKLEQEMTDIKERAAPTLKQLGIKVNISEREIRREDLLHNNTWTTRSKDPGNTTMASADLDLLLREDV
uniref:Uncharacterized protein n=1 Tax=Knipowitschia caucasica TaxID=637954 RepID=A0AAV2KT38_KNICA